MRFFISAFYPIGNRTHAPNGLQGASSPKDFLACEALGVNWLTLQIENVAIKISERALGRELACPYCSGLTMSYASAFTGKTSHP